MQIAEDVYVSDNLSKKKNEIIKKLRFGQFVKDVYVIYINNDTGRAEYMKSIFFFQKYMQSIYLKIIGITDDVNDANLFILRYAIGDNIDISVESHYDFVMPGEQ